MNYLWLMLMLAVPLTIQAAECPKEKIVENRKKPIKFVPFEMVNPETGKKYHPNDEIEIPTDSGKTRKIKASDYYKEVNDLEQKLNAWGYSLRDNHKDPVNLVELEKCAEKMKEQAKRIDESVRKEQAKFLESDDDWKKRWNTMQEEYVKNLPSWEQLYQNANDEKYKIYAPEVPVYQAPRPEYKRTEIKFDKQKSYSLFQGNDGTFSVDLTGYYKIGANKLEAKGEAGLAVNGGILNKWKGEIAKISIVGNSPGSGPLTLDLRASVLDGKKVFNKPLAKEGSLEYEDQFRASEAVEVEYRFAVGPIPMSARAGIRGEAGYKWGFNLYVLQIGAHTGPYAALDAYAEVGADVAVAGLGVGGRLRLAEYSLMLQGKGLFKYEDEPEVILSLALTSDLTLLAGDLYAYAYIDYPVPYPPWHDRSEWRYTFFDWEGIKKSGTLFDYRATYNRNGLIVEGDLSPEDIAEANGKNKLAYTELLESLALSAIDRSKKLSDWLNEDQNAKVLAYATALKDTSDKQQELVDEFWKKVKN